MITEFTLNNFRNHHQRHFSTDAPIILFTGDNGVGKTNCLEALSYLTAGRGLRHAKAEEILPQYPKNAETALMGWGVQAQVKYQKYQHRDAGDNTKLVKIATGFAPHQHKRHIFIDGVKQASQIALDDYVRMLWYIPQMARLFHDGRSGRLRLLDRIATLFDARHYGRLQAYEQQMRERLLVLIKHGFKHGEGKNQWLDVLENDMARRAVSIATTRSQMVMRLNQCAQTPPIKEFPKLTLTLQGEVEKKCDLQNAARSEDDYARLLSDYRVQDLQEQRTHFGIHRSDVEIGYYPRHSDNRMMPAQLCSTGEQKMIVMALILTQLQLLLQEESITPLLLLDDIAAHLDQQHVTALLSFLRHANVQLFLTGTKADFLSDLSTEYLHYALDISK